MAISGKAEKYFKKIQPKIEYCTTCQAYDGGEVIWVLGRQTDLEDLFNEYEVPDELRDEIADELHCNHCGVTIGRGAEIGLKTDEEIKRDRKRDQRWVKWYKTYEPKIKKFEKFLSKYPYLGLKDKIGKEIQSKISKFPKTDIVGEDWWRARQPDGSKKLISKDMYPPKYPMSEGRFNHYGQKVFYLASSSNAALLETTKDDECFAWVQKFHIKKAENLLDLDAPIDEDDIRVPIIALGLIHVTLPALTVKKDCPWKPQYFIPRFISDCAKEHGFKGIVFGSRNHYDKNLVLFEWEKDAIIHQDEPKIIQFNRIEW